MERLTNRHAEIPLPDSVHATYWALVHEKLARYEDAEQEGRLIVLPCKVGDTIYILRGDVKNGYETVKKTHVEEVQFRLGCLDKQMKLYPFYYLTRAEAEKAMEEVTSDA